MSEWNKKLTNGVGKCSVPMWSMGCPSGFCDADAFGERPECGTYRVNENIFREDGKYSGYVPGLACPTHGGPEKPFIDFLCDGPPGPEAGRFVEVEDATGHGINAGEWIKRKDGYYALRVELKS